MRRSRLVVAGVLGVIAALLVLWKLRGSGDSEGGGSGESGSDDVAGRGGDGAGGGRVRGLQAPASLSGRVTRASDGAGVPGAIVSVVTTDLMKLMGGAMGGDDKPPTLATTDNTGAWTIASVTPGTYEVAATASGLIPAHKKISVAAAAKATIDLALEAGGTVVSGTVSDVGGGPIRGAHITMTREDGSVFGGKAALVTLSDTEGHYKINLERGSYSATAKHEDYTRGHKRFELRGDSLTVDFTLAPGSSIRGIVVTRDGKPVPGAIVHAQGGRGMRDGGSMATADASGAFVLTSLGSGAMKLTASAKGYASNSPTVVELGIGEQVDGVKVVVDRAFTISGRVVRAAKTTEGIPGVMLGVFSMAAGQMAMVPEPTNDNGEFEIYGVKPASYMMFALGETTVPEIGKSIEVIDRDVTDVVLEMTTGATLSGKVELSGTAGIAEMSVELDQSKIGIANMFEAMKALVVHGETDAAGAFTLHNVPPGEFSLAAHMVDGRKGTLPVVVAQADQQGLIVKLEARASIAGKVVDEKGAVVAGVHVDVQEKEGKMQFRMSSRDGSSGALTGIDGGFEIVGLDAGKIDLVVGDDHGRIPFTGSNKEQQQFELAKGQKLTGVTLTVEARDGWIKGLVIGTDKAPVPDAWVSVRFGINPTKRREIMMSFFRPGEPILTGADGTFSIEKLRRDTYDVSVEGPKGASRASKSNVKTGETVTLVLESLGSIIGHVTVGGSPVAQFDLGCRPASFGSRFDSDSGSRRFTAADGLYSVDRLNPGEYACSVSSDQGTGSGKITVATGPVTLDLSLAPWATISGVVVDAVTGKGLPNLIVLASGDGFEGKAFADVLAGKGPTTDANGRFLVERVPAGKGQVHVAPRDATFNHLASRDFNATPGQRIDLGTIKLVLPHANEGGTLGFFAAVTDGNLMVVDVKPDTPAERAGVQDGDKILTIDNRPVSDLGADVAKQLLMPGSLGVGQVVALGLERAGKPVAVTLTAEKF